MLMLFTNLTWITSPRRNPTKRTTVTDQNWSNMSVFSTLICILYCTVGHLQRNEGKIWQPSVAQCRLQMWSSERVSCNLQHWKLWSWRYWTRTVQAIGTWWSLAGIGQERRRTHRGNCCKPFPLVYLQFLSNPSFYYSYYRVLKYRSLHKLIHMSILTTMILVSIQIFLITCHLCSWKKEYMKCWFLKWLESKQKVTTETQLPSVLLTS